MQLTRAALISAFIISTFSVPEQAAEISSVLAGGIIAAAKVGEVVGAEGAPERVGRGVRDGFEVTDG